MKQSPEGDAALCVCSVVYFALQLRLITKVKKEKKIEPYRTLSEVQDGRVIVITFCVYAKKT